MGTIGLLYGYMAHRVIHPFSKSHDPPSPRFLCLREQGLGLTA